MYLLDTNILSDLVRNPQGRINQEIARRGEPPLSTSIIVAAELRFGALKKASAKLSEQVEQVLAEIAVHDLAVPADSRYAEIRVALERQGRPIGQNDLFIAAQCLALDLTLVTDNEREFSRVPGLRIENWLR